MTPSAIARTSRHPGRPVEGAILYMGAVYDRQLRPCRICAVADGEGGMEWRVARGPFDSESGEASVERCFPTYAEAMKWIA
jgi:hypothetical protein